ncbi:MAG TPA: SRPBCC family protein [Hyphomicrobium sp.]|nr:SRPBCC family protein [Hyphomicrobium sp.]
MLRNLALLIAFASLIPASALAHGPSRQKVKEEVEINVPAAKVWAAIGNFQDMSWTGVFTKTEGTGGNDAGATRVLTLPNGTIDEKLNKYNAEGMMYAYEITKVDVKVVPVSNYSSSITVTADGDKSKVEWKGAFYRGYTLNDPPPELNDEAAVKAVEGLYKTALGNLKKKLEAGG